MPVFNQQEPEFEPQDDDGEPQLRLPKIDLNNNLLNQQNRAEAVPQGYGAGQEGPLRAVAVKMTTPCIITVAITGSVPRKEHNPAVPITISEQVDSTRAAFEAGATIAHVHVRRDDQTPTSDPERFAALACRACGKPARA